MRRSTERTSPTNAGPVAIPTPTDSAGCPVPSGWIAATASTISRAASTAARPFVASRSGAPNTIIIPSPLNSATDEQHGDLALRRLDAAALVELRRHGDRNVATERLLHGPRARDDVREVEANELVRHLPGHGLEERQVGRRVDVTGPLAPEADEADEVVPAADGKDDRDTQRLEGGAIERGEGGRPTALPGLRGDRRRPTREHGNERSIRLERRGDHATAHERRREDVARPGVDDARLRTDERVEALPHERVERVGPRAVGQLAEEVRDAALESPALAEEDPVDLRPQPPLRRHEHGGEQERQREVAGGRIDAEAAARGGRDAREAGEHDAESARTNASGSSGVTSQGRSGPRSIHTKRSVRETYICTIPRRAVHSQPNPPRRPPAPTRTPHPTSRRSSRASTSRTPVMPARGIRRRLSGHTTSTASGPTTKRVGRKRSHVHA
jgi:hypothetical protein